MKARLLQLNPNNEWVKQPLWKKRIQGFASYFTMAFMALIYPIEVDMVFYNDLKDEFIDKDARE